MFTRSAAEHDDHSSRHLRRGLRDLVEGAEELLRSTAAYGGAEMEGARDRLKHQLERARSQVGGWSGRAGDRYRRAADVADGYVHENGWKVAAAGIVLGVLLGVCLGRGRR